MKNRMALVLILIWFGKSNVVHFTQTRPDTWPLGNSSWVGWGCYAVRQGQDMTGQGRQYGWEGAIMLRNHHFSRFSVIQIFALPTYFPPYSPTDTPSLLIESLSKRIGKRKV